jgi:hypothetical protein
MYRMQPTFVLDLVTLTQKYVRVLVFVLQPTNAIVRLGIVVQCVNLSLALESQRMSHQFAMEEVAVKVQMSVCVILKELASCVKIHLNVMDYTPMTPRHVPEMVPV